MQLKGILKQFNVQISVTWSIVDLAAKCGDVFGPEDVMVISNNLKIHENVLSCKDKLAFIALALFVVALMLLISFAYYMSH